MRPTCRCTCTAYGGHCDCWFHGKIAGENEAARLKEAILKYLANYDFGRNDFADNLPNVLELAATVEFQTVFDQTSTAVFGQTDDVTKDKP